MLIFFDLFYTVKNKKAVKTINYDPLLKWNCISLLG